MRKNPDIANLMVDLTTVIEHLQFKPQVSLQKLTKIDIVSILRKLKDQQSVFQQ